jgi:methionyl-tRNA synthetase
VNSELVSIFGNFVNRVLVLSEKYYEGKVPRVITDLSDAKLLAARQFCFDQIAQSLHSMRQNLDAVKLRDAQADFINAARAGNKYLADTEPWKLIKTDEESVKAIMYDALQICAKLAIAAEPFLPHTAIKLKGLLGASELKWGSLFNENILKDGHQLSKSEVLYRQVLDEEITPQLERLQRIKSENEKAVTQQESQSSEKIGGPSHHPIKSDITYEDFDKIDLRAGKVLEAERVPKADKLLKLTVDLGFEKRTILSGIAEYYTPEELVGKVVTVVANLAPRKIRGIESQGMLLMAGNDFGKLYNVGSEKEIEPGSVVK